MKPVFSILITLAFLLQTFATAIAMPVNQVQQIEETKEHTCCVLKEVSGKDIKETSKKNCCAGDSKLSCCAIVYSLEPVAENFEMLELCFVEKTQFGYMMTNSEYLNSFFHPPRIV